MSSPHLIVRFYRPVVLTALFLACHVLMAGSAYAESAFEAVWFGNVVENEGQKLTFTLHYPESASVAEEIPLHLEIMTAIPYQACSIRLQVLDASGVLVDESEMTMDLHRGRDDVTIRWDAANLAPGLYSLVIVVDYVREFEPASCEVAIARVSAAHWRKRVEDLEAQLSPLEKGIESLAAEAGVDGATGAPHLRLRQRMVQDAVTGARQALEAEQWRVADRNIAYADEALNTLRTEMTFNKSIPETLSPHLPYPKRLEIRDGGLYDGATPLFLVGATLGADNGGSGPVETAEKEAYLGPDAALLLPQQVEWIKQHDLNFVVLPMAAGVDASVCRERVAALGQAAGGLQVPWALQLDQEDIAGSVMDAWPDLTEPGFVNMAHADFSQVAARSLKEMFSAAGAQAYPPVGISLARDPRFKYDGEPVRAEFIARVKEWYPDRQELNRVWHAHLADFEEITIWGEYPEHSYQNQRAYQYEWQNFHRGLITQFLSGLRQDLAGSAPGVPAMVTLSGDAFLPGETRNTPGRESLAAIMDISGCAARFEFGDGFYAMNYPVPHAALTLTRCYARNKPVLILDADIDVSKGGSVRQRDALVSSAVWEAVMSGATGMALSPHSTVFQYPEALAAYTGAAVDVNRLAPIIMAFQNAPEELAVLFSDASKIMDDGVPHLESAQFAFEGASFAGFPVRYITENQIQEGGLAGIKVLILPSTMAVPDATFEQCVRFVEEGGMVARVGTPIPYNEKGQSRSDVIRATGNTVLVRGMNLPTEYLHAMDAALVGGVLPEIVRPVNAHGYPLEGIRSRYVTHENEAYLYIINLRREPVAVYVSGLADSGRDLIRGRDIQFPRELAPLDPMLIRLNKQAPLVAVSD